MLVNKLFFSIRQFGSGFLLRSTKDVLTVWPLFTLISNTAKEGNVLSRQSFFLLKQVYILLIKDCFYKLSVYKVWIVKFYDYTAHCLHSSSFSAIQSYTWSILYIISRVNILYPHYTKGQCNTKSCVCDSAQIKGSYIYNSAWHLNQLYQFMVLSLSDVYIVGASIN